MQSDQFTLLLTTQQHIITVLWITMGSQHGAPDSPGAWALLTWALHVFQTHRPLHFLRSKSGHGRPACSTSTPTPDTLSFFRETWPFTLATNLCWSGRRAAAAAHRADVGNQRPWPISRSPPAAGPPKYLSPRSTHPFPGNGRRLNGGPCTRLSTSLWGARPRRREAARLGATHTECWPTDGGWGPRNAGAI